MANPYCSIIVLTLGAAPKVMECLKKQTFQDFEVIFAREKGIVYAMNLALGRARGEILVRIDDDVLLPPTWLSEILKPFSDPVVAGATGPTYVPWRERENRDSIRIWERPNWFLRWLTDWEFRPAGIYKCGVVSYDSNYEERFTMTQHFSWDKYEPDHLEGTNWAARTKLIREVGGFDPKFDGVAEWFDDDAISKIKKLGYKLRYNPKAILYHVLQFTEHYNDRFDGWGRIKNWLRFHKRHSRFHYKMVIFLFVWGLYFIHAEIKKCFARS